jgi:hypothetical protein
METFSASSLITLHLERRANDRTDPIGIGVTRSDDLFELWLNGIRFGVFSDGFVAADRLIEQVKFLQACGYMIEEVTQ